MQMNQVFFRPEDTEWQDLGGGVSRQILGHDDRLMQVKVKFEENATGSLHRHAHSQTTYVAEGAFEVTIGREKAVLRRGDSFFVPSNQMHGVVCLEAGVLIDCFSPAREDFL